MPTYYARANGTINAAIWATTPTGTAASQAFTSDDVLVSNSFVVQVNVNTTVFEIRNDTTGGAVGGGGFNMVTSGVTLTANVIAGAVGGSSCLASSAATATLVGTITGGTSNSANGVSVSSGILNVVGACVAGPGAAACPGVLVNGGILNLTGTASGNTSGTGGSSHGISVSSAVSVANVTGTAVGGINSASAGVAILTAGGTATIVGTAVGGPNGPGALNNVSGNLTVTRAKGNGFGNGSTGIGSAVGVASVQASNTRVLEIEYGDLGQSPTSGPTILADASTNVAVFFRGSGGKKTLVDNAATVDYPSNSNVRLGVVFANGNRTGTCAVPAASSVASGVPVDNTTGTAVLTSAAAQSACNAALSAFSSGRLANVATVASTGQQLADAVTA